MYGEKDTSRLDPGSEICSNNSSNLMDIKEIGNIDQRLSALRQKYRCYYKYISVSSSEGRNQENTEYKMEGYLALDFGDLLNKKYFVIRKMGWGHFSTVWLCWDIVDKRFVALKCLRCKESYFSKSMDEVQMLNDIKMRSSSDKLGFRHIVELLDRFVLCGPYGRHFCIVMEMLGMNLLNLLHISPKGYLNLSIVRRIAQHILIGLNYMHERCGIIHTDIKPENIVVNLTDQEIAYMAEQAFFLRIDLTFPYQFRSNVDFDLYTEHYKYKKGTPYALANATADLIEHIPFANKVVSVASRIGIGSISDNELKLAAEKQYKEKKKSIQFQKNKQFIDSLSQRTFKICDMGNAVYCEEACFGIIQTLEYRSPEVVIRSSYSYNADVWSLACTLFEIATGDYLFYPDCQAFRSKNDRLLYEIIKIMGTSMFKDPDPNWEYSRRYFDEFGRIRKHYMPNKITSIERILINRFEWDKNEAINFSRFLLPMLHVDPAQRSSAGKAFLHYWLRD